MEKLDIVSSPGTANRYNASIQLEGEEMLEMGKGSVMRSNDLRLKRETVLGL